MKINLTPERIRKLTCPAGKQQAFLWDQGSRLAVRVTAAGAKAFIYQGTLRGQTIRCTIGGVDAWDLVKARKEANRLQSLLDQGIDPREQEREQQAAREAKKAAQAEAKRETEAKQKYTLKALCEAYVQHLQKKGKAASAASARSMFKCHVDESEIAGKAAKEITALEIAAIIRKVHEANKQRAAGVLRSYLGAAFECAVKAPLDSALPASLTPFGVTVNPVRAVPAIAVKARNRTLSADELKGYLAALGDDVTDEALKLALFTAGQRMSQLLRATPADWDGTNLRLFDGKGKRATPREHLLPPGPKAAALIAGRAKKGNAFLFSAYGKVATSPFTCGKRVAEISAALGGDPFDLRDIRRTCETMLAGMGISRDVRAQLLSHGLSGVQAVHYDRHDYLEQKAAALKAWEARLDEIASGTKRGNVVKIRRRAK